MTKTTSLPVEYDEKTGDYYIQFPDDVLKDVGWKEGDTVEWIDNKDGSWTLKKKEI